MRLNVNESTKITAEVQSGRIVLRTPLVNVLACKRVPGGLWHDGLNAWFYPATPQHARMLLSLFPAAEVSPAFKNLVHQIAAAPLVPAPGPNPGPSAPPQVPPTIRLTSGRSVPIAAPNPPAAQVTLAVPPPTSPSVAQAVPLPAGIRATPWRHQVEAFQFVLGAPGPVQHRAALLAMKMGTGKTLTALMVLAALKAQRVLVTCPLRVVPVWDAQINACLANPPLVAALDDGGTVAARTAAADLADRRAVTEGRGLVVVVNYDAAWREAFAAWAKKRQWDLIIADESHRIKNPSGRASRFMSGVLRARSKFRLALTGTPMPHSPLDVYAQYRFLTPAIFGGYYGPFKQRYARWAGPNNIIYVGPQNLNELREKMAAICFQVGKEVLDLPPETSVTYECTLGAEAARVYRDLETELVAKIGAGEVTAANALVKLLRLQQLTGGHIKTDEGVVHAIDTAKQKLLQDTLEDIAPTYDEQGVLDDPEPVVVFCWFHEDLDAVHNACRGAGMKSLEISGRRDELKRWQSGEAQVLAVQIAAGGEGVDMTRARYAILYSFGFSLGKYEQALARVHRPGQTRPVTYIHLVVRGTVDVRVMRALAVRADVVNSILSEIRNGRSAA